ncbi:MAG TPA: PhzF family phenazine biosynthesis protein [Candidatus Dormibacteraeota bacterium]|jgi:trans-2,3-dihydro-3-hydroxyanthranilate isomerase|nr:PhzF family phenazine biosynthesis protein [Candidatus Dormibacteraeota bacterium]
MQHRFHTLDVFTTNRFEGNPLAVFTDGDGLSDDQMQVIAREMNLAETVFVQKPTDDRALARLRIFTTNQELKLAGHPVIGTWFLLAELGVVPAQEGGVHVMQQTGAGILPVEIRFKDGRPNRVTMTQTEAAFKPAKIKKAALAKALGLSPKDLDPHLEPECVSTGIFNLMVPLKSRAALSKVEMNMSELRRLIGKGSTMAYCFVLSGSGKAQARGMLPWELYEDPATGSAAGSLGAYLVKHGKLTPGHTLSILQGVEMGRPSHIEVEISTTGKKLVPRVSGAAVRIFEGTFLL